MAVPWPVVAIAGEGVPTIVVTERKLVMEVDRGRHPREEYICLVKGEAANCDKANLALLRREASVWAESSLS